MLDNFSSSVQKVLAYAESLAKEFSHTSVGSEHLLLSILKNEDLTLSKELKSQNIKYETFSEKIKNLYLKEKKVRSVIYSLELKQILEDSIKLTHKNKDSLVSIDCVSISLLTINNTAYELLINEKVDVEKIVKKLLSSFKKKSELLSISDLHLLGVNNKDPLIGRDNEIIQLVYALSRRNKPNAILIGEPGVGKTAIVEELAKRLVDNQIPLLKNKYIYELDLASTVSGTKYRGEFEEKLKKIIKKVKEDGHAILFIDEIHNVIKAGGAEGAIDASNILKPYLARGEIQLIGATTLEEFSDSFDKDKALKRRFQIIDVNEPTLKEVENILYKVKSLYEDYYDIDIPNSLIPLVVDLSNTYIVNQRFPDKAIELLDNSCVISEKVLSEQDIITTMNKLYGVNISDKEKIDNFEKDFDNNVINQKDVKEKLVQTFNEGNINSLLLYGQNGCGKNLVSQLIGKALFNNNVINIKIDNYLELNGINKLISNGVNYSLESVSPLVKTLKERPNSVIVFENVERMNSELISFFENTLEKGYFIDTKGLKISVKNALFIFLLNEDNSSKISFNFYQNKGVNSLRNRVEEKLGYKLTSLIDDLVEFDKFKVEDYEGIINKELVKHNLQFELGTLTSVEEKELLNNGGDAAIKKAKEIIKEEKSKKVKNF